MAEAARRTRPGGTWWCWIQECPEHGGRESARGIPAGWLHVALGLPEGTSAFLSFCSVACLRKALQRAPHAFQVLGGPGRRAEGGAG